MKKIDLVIVAAVLAVMVFAAGAVKGYLELPTVYYSHSNNRILLVEYADGRKTTNPQPKELPEKYVRVIVK